MSRLYLFVEGKTEQTFADTVPSPHLANRGVYLQPAVEIAHSRRRGRSHRGGGRAYLPMRNEIERFTKQENYADVYFSTLIDLYAIAPQFPGLADAERYRLDPYQRVQALQKSWAADLPDRRFIPFIALHEFETYLLAQPEQLALFYSDDRKRGSFSSFLITNGRRQWSVRQLRNQSDWLEFASAVHILTAG